jgi:hypothetical protein
MFFEKQSKIKNNARHPGRFWANFKKQCNLTNLPGIGKYFFIFPEEVEMNRKTI